MSKGNPRRRYKGQIADLFTIGSLAELLGCTKYYIKKKLKEAKLNNETIKMATIRGWVLEYEGLKKVRIESKLDSYFERVPWD